MTFTSGFDSMFDSLNISFYAGMNYLAPYCILLLRLFFAYQVIWGMIKKPTELPFMTVALDVIRYGVIYYIITNYRTLTDELRDTFIKFGSLAASTGSTAFRISDIYNKWWKEAGKPIYEYADSLSILTNPGSVLLYSLAFIFIMLILIVLCAYIFLVKLEFVAVATLGIVFLPFYMFEKTAFIGEVWFKMMINNAIRLMVLSFLVFLTIKQSSIISLDLTKLDGIFILIGSFTAITVLVLKVPALMSSVISGSPQIGQGATISKLANSAGKQAGKKVGSAAASVASAVGTGGMTAVSKAAQMMKK